MFNSPGWGNSSSWQLCCVSASTCKTHNLLLLRSKVRLYFSPKSSRCISDDWSMFWPGLIGSEFREALLDESCDTSLDHSHVSSSLLALIINLIGWKAEDDQTATSNQSMRNEPGVIQSISGWSGNTSSSHKILQRTSRNQKETKCLHQRWTGPVWLKDENVPRILVPREILRFGSSRTSSVTTRPAGYLQQQQLKAHWKQREAWLNAPFMAVGAKRVEGQRGAHCAKYALRTREGNKHQKIPLVHPKAVCFLIKGLEAAEQTNSLIRLVQKWKFSCWNWIRIWIHHKRPLSRTLDPHVLTCDVETIEIF